MKFIFIVSLLVLFSLAGCAVTPLYIEPANTSEVARIRVPINTIDGWYVLHTFEDSEICKNRSQVYQYRLGTPGSINTHMEAMSWTKIAANKSVSFSSDWNVPVAKACYVIFSFIPEKGHDYLFTPGNTEDKCFISVLDQTKSKFIPLMIREMPTSLFGEKDSWCKP